MGKLADLRICTQCEEAYYCNQKCERAHAKVPDPVCVATVAAKAQHSHRVRLARDVREKGSGNVEGGEEDGQCVICMEPPEAPVKVRRETRRMIFPTNPRARITTPFRSCVLTVAVRPQVLPEVHRGVGKKGDGEIMPPLPQSVAARAREAF